MRSPKRPVGQQIAIVLALIGILAMALGGYLTPLLRTVTSPIFNIQEWISTRYLAFQDFFSSPAEIADLRQENLILRGEISQLDSQIIDLRQQLVDAAILTALLDFARAQPQNAYMAATVIGRDPSPFLHYVIINRGSDDGVQRGMPVVGVEGLIGRITHVTSNAARVQLITDPETSINVEIQPSEGDAVLFGSVTSDIRLDFISQDYGVQPGDLVLTSGLGGNFPPNIVIGQISSVRTEATALFQQASVEPAVNFSRIDIVLIIINFQAIDISPLLNIDEMQ